MRVILLQNIKGIGRMGDVKDVSDGYGRNYLLANRLAKLATQGTVKEAEALKKKADEQTKIQHEKAKEIAAKVKDIVLTFEKKTSKTGTLFASLTKEEVAEDLSRAIGGKVEPDSINFKEHGEHIKHGGEHMIEVELSPEVRLEIKVVVNPLEK